MQHLHGLLRDLESPNANIDGIAQAILDSDLETNPKLALLVRQAAQEVMHFQKQLEQADSAQWRQSFLYELNESLKTLKKHLKKLVKE